MKLVIEVTETLYEACKEWQEANVSNWSENVIAKGTPYEERPKGKTNADLFKQTFGMYATEIWSMNESQFLEWLNEEVKKNEG